MRQNFVSGDKILSLETKFCLWRETKFVSWRQKETKETKRDKRDKKRQKRQKETKHLFCDISLTPNMCDSRSYPLWSYTGKYYEVIRKIRHKQDSDADRHILFFKDPKIFSERERYDPNCNKKASTTKKFKNVRFLNRMSVILKNNEMGN